MAHERTSLTNLSDSHIFLLGGGNEAALNLAAYLFRARGFWYNLASQMPNRSTCTLPI